MRSPACVAAKDPVGPRCGGRIGLASGRVAAADGWCPAAASSAASARRGGRERAQDPFAGDKSHGSSRHLLSARHPASGGHQRLGTGVGASRRPSRWRHPSGQTACTRTPFGASQLRLSVRDTTAALVAAYTDRPDTGPCPDSEATLSRSPPSGPKDSNAARAAQTAPSRFTSTRPRTCASLSSRTLRRARHRRCSPTRRAVRVAAPRRPRRGAPAAGVRRAPDRPPPRSPVPYAAPRLRPRR